MLPLVPVNVNDTQHLCFQTTIKKNPNPVCMIQLAGCSFLLLFWGAAGDRNVSFLCILTICVWHLLHPVPLCAFLLNGDWVQELT